MRSGRVTEEQCCLPFRTLRWLVWLSHTGTSTFISRLPFWWRWDSYGLLILSSGWFALKVLCFPQSYLWSNILCIVISLQGGKVAEVAARSWRSFNAEHVSLIQIHDHISYMALQLWVRCLFSLCHISLNVILHACTHTLQHHVRWACARSHTLVLTLTSLQQRDSSKNSLHRDAACPHAQSQPLKTTQIHTNRVHTAALLLSSPAAVLRNEQRRSDACSWAIMSSAVARSANLPMVQL